VLPNALQIAMFGTFIYVVLLALVRRRAAAIGILALLFSALVLAEEGGSGRLWVTLLFAAALVIPLLYAFIRYGLLTLATAMAVNQALQIAPLTLDLTKPHALASSMAIVVVGGLAAYASRRRRTASPLHADGLSPWPTTLRASHRTPRQSRVPPRVDRPAAG
jgi:hypothetical protein